MSPFMSGLLIGMTIFSALSLQWAKSELIATQQRQAEQARAQAEDLAGAMEFAVLTENANAGLQAYDENYNLARARQFSNAVGTTRGGNEVLVTTRTAEEDTTFGAPKTQVALTATDDTLQRAEINRVGSAEDLNRAIGNKTPSALFDAGGVRQRQVLTSNQRMEVMAEQLYAYYATQLTFPSASEWTTMEGKLGIRDAWGKSFVYALFPDGQSAELSFTTPWGFTQKLAVSLQEGTSVSESETN
jgi:hypothetical protein